MDTLISLGALSFAVILLALATFALVTGVRKLPKVEVWTAKGIRPFGCDFCMSLWCSSVLAWGAAKTELVPGYLVGGALLPAVGLAFAILLWTHSVVPDVPADMRGGF